MRKRATPLACACAMIAAAPLASVHAQDEESRAANYARMAELPPMEGVWQADWGTVTRLRAAEKDAPLSEAARSQFEAFQAAKQRGENLQTEAANCRPVGMPGAMRTPYPVEFVYSPGKLNILIETHSQLRQVWTDGRAIPEDPDLLFNGNSVGRWEGDELIVETVGLSPQISILDGIHPTERTRMSERIRLAEPGRMLIETTITDTALFTAPYVTELAYNLEPDWELREYVCQENNRDAADEEGRPSMDLGFDEFD